MIERYQKYLCFSTTFGRQMRFVTGPRQVGKSTLAKEFLKGVDCESLYYNWDLRSIKNRFLEDNYFYNGDALKILSKGKKWICFDEIHKYPKWKDVLKDGFDSYEDKYSFLVTGSARLDFFRKSGDSLAGRYFIFRLYPISLFELTGGKLILPSMKPRDFIQENIKSSANKSLFDNLLKFGGYPEPLVKGAEIFSKLWHEEYIDVLIKNDLRDLTKIHDLENVAKLIHLLPTKIASPLSLNSLVNDMQTSYNAIRNYVRSLILTYIIFKIPPYHEKLSRVLSKESKVYFFDWTRINDAGKRFENYVACELKNRIELWNLSCPQRYDLFYIRTRDKKETDFLITCDNKPYLLIEAKTSLKTFERHNIDQAKKLNVPLLQIISDHDFVKASKDELYIVSASNFFA